MDNLVPDDHDPNEEGYYAEIRFRFIPDSAKDGNTSYLIGAEMHLHNSPSEQLIDALLTTAQKLVGEKINDEMFSDSVPAEVRESLSASLAVSYLVSRLQSSSFSTMPIDAVVPDDASELFKE